MQQRICDCWLDVGGCFCTLETNEKMQQVSEKLTEQIIQRRKDKDV